VVGPWLGCLSLPARRVPNRRIVLSIALCFARTGHPAQDDETARALLRPLATSYNHTTHGTTNLYRDDRSLSIKSIVPDIMSACMQSVTLAYQPSLRAACMHVRMDRRIGKRTRVYVCAAGCHRRFALGRDGTGHALLWYVHALTRTTCDPWAMEAFLQQRNWPG
jgi:hypothetical protein